MERYEVKDVSDASEILACYKKAVEDNVKYYRAVSKTNKIYGWDEKVRKFVPATVNQEWFENPHYTEPIVEEVVEEPIKEDLEEVIEQPAEEVVESVEEQAEEVVAENETTEAVEEIAEPEQPDYKALYEEKCSELEKAEKERDFYAERLSKVNEEFTEYKSVVERFKAL